MHGDKYGSSILLELVSCMKDGHETHWIVMFMKSH